MNESEKKELKKLKAELGEYKLLPNLKVTDAPQKWHLNSQEQMNLPQGDRIGNKTKTQHWDMFKQKLTEEPINYEENWKQEMQQLTQPNDKQINMLG